MRPARLSNCQTRRQKAWRKSQVGCMQERAAQIAREVFDDRRFPDAIGTQEDDVQAARGPQPSAHAPAECGYLATSAWHIAIGQQLLAKSPDPFLNWHALIMPR